MNLEGYMGVTAHFCAQDSHGNLVIRSHLIGFRKLEGSHNGVNMARELLKVIDEVGISHKVSSKQLPRYVYTHL